MNFSSRTGIKENLEKILKAFGIRKYTIKQNDVENPKSKDEIVEVFIYEWLCFFQTYDGFELLKQYFQQEPSLETSCKEPEIKGKKLLTPEAQIMMGELPSLLNESIRESSCKSAIKFNDKLTMEQS
jgi:hypothetical protein